MDRLVLAHLLLKTQTRPMEDVKQAWHDRVYFRCLIQQNFSCKPYAFSTSDNTLYHFDFLIDSIACLENSYFVPLDIHNSRHDQLEVVCITNIVGNYEIATLILKRMHTLVPPLRFPTRFGPRPGLLRSGLRWQSYIEYFNNATNVLKNMFSFLVLSGGHVVQPLRGCGEDEMS